MLGLLEKRLPQKSALARLWNWSKFLEQPWDNELYRSWLKIVHVDVSNGPAVVATQSHCSYWQLLFGFRPSIVSTYLTPRYPTIPLHLVHFVAQYILSAL